VITVICPRLKSTRKLASVALTDIMWRENSPVMTLMTIHRRRDPTTDQIQTFLAAKRPGLIS